MDARSLAEAIVEKLAGEVDDAEVSVEVTDRVSYEIDNELLVPALSADLWRVSMRALRGGALATAATTVADAGEAAGALRRALGAASAGPLAEFARPGEVDDDRRGWDAATDALIDAPGTVRALAAALRDQTRATRGGVAVESLEGAVNVKRTRRALRTLRGGAVTARATSFFAYVGINGNDTDYVHGVARPAEDDAVAGLGRRLLARLPAREVSREEFLGTGREALAVFDPSLLETLLRALLIERVGLDRVLAGTSSARVGDALAHASVTLTDDTAAVRSLVGAATDDEGVAGQRRAVLERGVLRVLLADRRSAAQAGGGAASTGNGFRIPILAEDRAEAPVRVGLGHLEMAAGELPRAALTRGKALAVLDLLGVHSANKATGAFNNPITGGLALEDGVPVARLAPGTWSATGNLFTMLRELAGLSRERHDTGSAVLPWIAAPVRVV
jgi:PmbA protein